MNKSLKGVGLSVILFGLSGSVLAQPELKTKPDPTPASIKEDLKFAKSLSRAFNHAATTIRPSVVHITEFSKVYQRQGFWGPVEEVVRPTGAGSGVIVSADGYILTNNHVIDGAERVKVKLADEREFDGRVIGTDPATDLGVVKIEASNLSPATFGDSDDLDVGEWVLAVGSPFGEFDNTVTAGIVSATGRTGLAAQSDDKFEDFIQTDAAINPGNSGGPLVNLEGLVVGINSQIASRTGGSVGIGFSIPSSISRSVMDMLIKSGRVERGAIGINNMAVAPKGSGKFSGVMVGFILPGSPAEKAGLKNGDIVTRFNGRPVDTVNRLRNAIAFTPPGTVADLEVASESKARALKVTIGDRTDFVSGSQALKKFGFSVDTLDPQVARQLGTRGVIVKQVEPLGPAAQVKTPLIATDIIVNVDGQPITDVSTFDDLMKANQNNKVRLDIIRGWGRQKGYIDIPARK